MSTVAIPKKSLLPGVAAVLRLLKSLRLLSLLEDDEVLKINNMTLINLVLSWFGPLHEARLATYLLVIQVIQIFLFFNYSHTKFFQVLCSIIAFLIRYPLAYIFYEMSW